VSSCGGMAIQPGIWLCSCSGMAIQTLESGCPLVVEWRFRSPIVLFVDSVFSPNFFLDFSFIFLGGQFCDVAKSGDSSTWLQAKSEGI
jgi:hypothetical protein